MEIIPSRAILKNHTNVTGPKIFPTPEVPWYCTANRIVRINTVIGIIYGSKKGVATFNPSTALSTEMAGVIIPSP